MTAASLDLTDLTDALAWVAKASPARPNVPVLAGIRVTFTDGEVTLTAFDYETMHTARLPAITTSHGEVVVPGRQAAQMVASLAGDTVRLDPGPADGLTVKAGRTVFRLPGLPAGDYPDLPNEPPTVGRVPAGQLQDAVAAAWGGAGRDDMLPVLTGVHLTGVQDQLTAVGTDRFRIHRATVTWQPTEEFTALVPGTQLHNAVTGLTGVVTIGHRVGQIRFSTPTRTVNLRLLEGEFPKVTSLIPRMDDMAVVVDVDVHELRAALRRASLALEGHSAAQVRVTADTLEIDASQYAATAGTAVDTLDAVVTRPPGDDKPYEIGFNPRFLGDAAAALGTTRAFIGFHDSPAKPALLAPNDPDRPADHVTHVEAVVMPRRLLQT